MCIFHKNKKIIDNIVLIASGASGFYNQNWKEKVFVTLFKCEKCNKLSGYMLTTSGKEKLNAYWISYLENLFSIN